MEFSGHLNGITRRHTRPSKSTGRQADWMVGWGLGDNLSRPQALIIMRDVIKQWHLLHRILRSIIKLKIK